MNHITYTKKMVKPTIMVDNKDLLGIYTWEDAIKQIKLLNSLNYKGFNDWRLPSKEELKYLYSNKKDIGGFANYFYWSSSEFEASNAWHQNFNDGYQDYNSKYLNYQVRIIRSI